jgi:Arc/MetJ-type ribon-helix-helix transcriptional regulator
MSVNFTVRLPKELAEKMKRCREINWSEVMRTAIEEYLRKLEELRTEESSSEILERLRKLGVSREDLQLMSLEVEKKLHETLEKSVEERRQLLRGLENA